MSVPCILVVGSSYDDFRHWCRRHRIDPMSDLVLRVPVTEPGYWRVRSLNLSRSGTRVVRLSEVPQALLDLIDSRRRQP